MKIDQEKYNRGLALLKKLHGGHAVEALVDALKDICPDYVAALYFKLRFMQVFHS